MSPGLSSTRRTRGRAPSRGFWVLRDSEVEGGAFADRAFGPDPAAVALHDPMGRREANAGAGEAGAAENLKAGKPVFTCPLPWPFAAPGPGGLAGGVNGMGGPAGVTWRGVYENVSGSGAAMREVLGGLAGGVNATG